MSAVLAGAPPSRPRRPGRDPRAVARELRILLAFRLSAGGRDPRRSVALIVLLALGLGLGVPVAVAVLAPTDFVGRAVAITPAVWFLFLLAAVVGALASSGGREVLSRREALAFPVSSTVDQLGALVLTPLNVAWSLQACIVLAATAYTVGPQWYLVPALIAALVWIMAATGVAFLLGWCAELARTYPAGPLALRFGAALSVAGLAALFWAGGVGQALDSLPTVTLFLSAVSTEPVRYALTQFLVAGLGIAALLAAVPIGERLERRPTPVESGHETRSHRRRQDATAELTASVVVDVRSILRSPPLRRGLVLLMATPLLVAALFPLPWVGVVVLPALVASGTALLHGVNVVALDGRGAVWRESLPHHADTTLVGRLVALGVLCGGSSLLVVTVAGLRTGTPSDAELIGVGLAVIVATAQVVSRCARWSLRHPYPTELRRPRDTPAPPAAMASYSVRLSASTTGGAVVLGVAMTLDSTALCVSSAALLLAPSLWRLAVAFRDHSRTETRSRVAAAVVGN